MPTELVVAVAGAIISVLVETVPGFSTFWESWKWKRMAMFWGYIIIAVAAMFLACQGVGVGFECVAPFLWAGLWEALKAAFLAYTGSQIMYVMLTRKRMADRHKLR